MRETEHKNVDSKVVDSFGEEWSRFPQTALAEDERRAMFADYFKIFPWNQLPEGAEGADIGCGSGRWAYFVAPTVGVLHCVEPSSKALEVAKNALSPSRNCRFWNCDIDTMPFLDSSLDFAYSLGVLHHTPDPAKALRQCVKKLRKGAPFLIYVYYAFDNKPLWFRVMWRVSDLFRRAIAKLPLALKAPITDTIALVIYWPFSRAARIAEQFGVPLDSFPLSYYRNRSFYVLRTDALDRFGTRLEHRFTRDQLLDLMTNAGLHGVQFGTTRPYWCAVGIKG